MTFSSRLLTLVLIFLTGCVGAKDPLAGGDNATFAIFPDRLKASAELSRAGADSFGKPKSQLLHFDVCLQSLATGQNVAAGSKFVIADGHGGERERAVDSAGCIHWDEEHDVQPLAPERNVRVERRIRAVNNHRGSVTLTFNVKPWLEGPGAVESALNQQQFANAITAGPGLTFEAGYPVNSSGTTALEVDDSTHFDLADNTLELSYVEVGRANQFEVDSFLNLTIPYRFNYSFSPRITRKVFSGALQSDAMTSGKLRVTFVFFASAGDEFKDDKRYLTSVQVETEVGANGRVAGSLILKYPHMLFASGRQTVLMQISAPSRRDVAARSFSGSVSAIDHQGQLTALADGRDAEVIHRDRTRERLDRAKTRATPFEEFLATHDVIRTDVNDFPLEKTRAEGTFGWATLAGLVSREELTYALTQDQMDVSGFSPAVRRSIPARLCHTYADMNADLTITSPIKDFKTDYVRSVRLDHKRFAVNPCPADTPDAAVIVQQLSFVERLETPVPRNVFIHTYANQDFGVFFSRDTSDTVMGGFGIHLPDFLGGKFVDANLSAARTSTFSRRGSFGQNQSMAVDAGELEVNARVRNCLLITGKKAPFVQKPWLVCDNQVRKSAWIKEHFFYYSQLFGANHSPFIDPYNAQSGVKVLVRGHYRMMHITQTLQNTDYRTSGFNAFVDAQTPNLNDFDTTGKLDALTNQGVPGAIERY